MSDERLNALKRILIGALELPAERRSAWVARACDGDEELRAEAEAKWRGSGRTHPCSSPAG